MTILGMFSCTGRFPFSCHATFLVFKWSSEQTFFVSPIYSPYNHNLIRKNRGNCWLGNSLLLLLHSIVFSFAADVMMTLNPVFRGSFRILDPIIGIHGSLTMLLSVFSVSGAWRLFSLIIEYKWFQSGLFSTNISTRKFHSSSKYFSEHNFFALDTNLLKRPLINDVLTYECVFIWTFKIAFFRFILNSYFPVPVFIIVTSKNFSLREWSSFSIMHCIALFFCVFFNIQKTMRLT